MPSTIDPNRPEAGVPALTRKWLNYNFQACKDEVEALQARTAFLETIIIELQPAGHGSMSMTDGPEAGSDLGAGWQTLDQMNEIIVSERGVDLTVDTGEISFSADGAWQLVFQVNFSHNADPAMARTTNIRVFNVTDSQPGQSVPISLGRATTETAATVSLNLVIPSTDLGETFRFEIGGGDTVTSVVYNVVAVQCYYHDRLGSLVVPSSLGF